MKRSSSSRLTLLPSHRCSRCSTAMPTSLGCWRPLGLQLACRPLHGLDDVLIAGAAADVARERPADLLLAWIRLLLEQGRRNQHHPRRAEAALEAVLLLEALLHGMQRAVAHEALDRGQRAAVGLHRHEGEGLDRR